MDGWIRAVSTVTRGLEVSEVIGMQELQYFMPIPSSYVLPLCYQFFSMVLSRQVTGEWKMGKWWGHTSCSQVFFFFSREVKEGDHLNNSLLKTLTSFESTLK